MSTENELYQCDSIGCDRIFNDEEYNITNNQTKCILHCEKNTLSGIALLDLFYKELTAYSFNKSSLSFINFPEDSSQRFNEFISSFNKIRFGSCSFHNNIGYSDNIEFFQNCIFYKAVIIGRRKEDNHSYFNNCTFKGRINNYQEKKSKIDINGNIFNKCLFEVDSDNLLEHIHFKKAKFTGEIFTNIKKLTRIYFDDCEFNIKFSLSKILSIEELIINNSIFNKGFSLYNIQKINFLNINDTKVNDISSINYCKNIDKLFFKLNIVNSKDFLIENTNIIDSDFYKTEFLGNVSFYKTNFLELVTFNETLFSKKVNFQHTKLKDKVSFRNSKFEAELNLIDSIIDKNANFLDIKLSEFKKLSNRETARIIKNSFEQENNIIEANRFYALEMKEREKELNLIKNPFEWLVFKFHGLSSNHSQNWLLALFWIINLTFSINYLSYEFICENRILHLIDRSLMSVGCIFFVGYIISKFKDEYINLSLFITTIFTYLIYRNSYIGDSDLKEFSTLINPFAIMTKGEDLTFGTLVFKILISYLIYQLIISIRQNTRRK